MVYATAYPIATTPPRPVYFLNRGNDKTPGVEVTPGALACLANLSADLKLSDANDEGSRRAALARWLTDPRNPLTARSIANRVWQYHFDRGIVDTPNDFGHMGSSPTHPELLDWLATELIAGGAEPGQIDKSAKPRSGEQSNSALRIPNSEFRRPWSLKHLHRLILTSAVYRQSSRNDPRFAEIDSGNQSLWRMNRRRLEAEPLRDAVLAVSGKLDLKMGGPSDQIFFFKDDHSPVYDYERFDVDSPAGFRRSVYRFIVRSVPDPFMDCLDCADPSLLTPRRNTTLTALQALSLLNNRFMIRQAEHFAARLEQKTNDRAAQVALACQLALGRDPSEDERRLLGKYAAENGLVNMCRVILNSNEFLFVD
jgi:hypothetical protein